MAMRRPRIKAAANLMSSKRKPKTQNTNTNNSTIECASEEVAEKAHASEISATQADKKNEPNTEKTTSQEETTSKLTETLEATQIKAASKQTLKVATTNATKSPASQNEAATAPSLSKPVATETDIAFKQPPRVEYQRQYSADSSRVEDVFHPELEQNVLQMDLQKSTNGFPLSPTKMQPRPRIRPAPIMGQRRNSYVGCSPSPHAGDDSGSEFAIPSPRRERYHSTSLVLSSSGVSPHLSGGASPAHSPHKYMPTMSVRTRTESTCSSYSDMYSGSLAAAPTKTRKAQNEEPTGHAQWRRSYEMRCINGVPDKSQMKMFDLIYYNPSSNPMEVKSNGASASSAENETAKEAKTVKEPLNSESQCESESNASALPVPQLKLNANNELVIDDKSLEIETTAEQEARKMLANTSLIFVDENTGMNGFYKRQKRTKEWPREETIKFYRCLQAVGTDFSLMSQLFPQRSRRDLKLKFKKEERSNGALINKALLYPTNFNVDDLKQQLEADDRQREEEKRKWLEIQAQQATKVPKVKGKKYSRAARTLCDGVEVYKNENVPKHKLSYRARSAQAPRTEALASENNNILEESTTSDTKIILKSHVEKRILNNDTLATKEPKKRKIKSDTIGKSKSGPRKPKLVKSNIKAEHASQCENSSDHPEEVQPDAKQLEQELIQLLHNAEDDENPESSEHNDLGTSSYTSKTLVDMDNGRALRIWSEDDDLGLGMLDDDTDHTYVPMDLELEPNVITPNTIVSSPSVLETTKFPAKSPPTEITTETTIKIQSEENSPRTQTPPAVLVHESTTSTTTSLNAMEEPSNTNQVKAKEEAPTQTANEVDEETIQRIVDEIEEGGLMLVSSLDPQNPDNLINEIYMIDKSTGDLCEKPLDLPEDIVQAIIELAT